MAAATITLNLGTGGDKPLVDTLTTVDGVAAPAGASAQMVKIGHGAASDFKTASAANPMPVSGPVTVTANGFISTANSTAVALGIGGVFTGAWEDVTEFSDIRVSVFADQPSAADGLQIQQSSNGVNADISDNYSIPINTGKLYSESAACKFYRVVYTNTGTAQTVFRLQTKLHKGYGKGSSVRPQDARTNDNDHEEMLAFSMTYDGVNWNRQRGTVANGMAVDVTRLSALVTGTASIGTVVLTAETTKVVGTVNIAAAQTVGLVAGAAVVGALVANQSVNATQINGVALAVGSGVSGTGVPRVVLATDVIQPAVSEIRAATLHVTATAAVNTAATASLPAPAAGLFHYITSIQVVKLYNVLGVAAGAGVVITSTNLPGTPAWTTEQAAGAVGTAPMVINYQPTTPLKAALAATISTIACPAQLQTIWRINVSYFVAA